MASRDRDAPFGVERNDRSPVKCLAHVVVSNAACCATFRYLLPLYREIGARVKRFFFSATSTYGRFFICNILTIYPNEFIRLCSLIEVDSELEGEPWADAIIYGP